MMIQPYRTDAYIHLKCYAIEMNCANKTNIKRSAHRVRPAHRGGHVFFIFVTEALSIYVTSSTYNL